MTNSKPGKIVPWSYSSLSAYETCPRRFFFTKISKQVSEPQAGPALAEGREAHKDFELAVKGEKALPAKWAKFNPVVERLRSEPGHRHVEYKFALTSDLRPTDFWAPDAWVRGALDVAVVSTSGATILDWKTGKRKFDIDQLRLFALAGFALWPHIKQVDTGYAWLHSKKLDRERFTREQKVELHREFASRVNRMEKSQEEDKWPPRPSGLCREYCPVGRTLCEHCGK